MTRIQKIMAVAIVALLALTAEPAVADTCVTGDSVTIGNVTRSCDEGQITVCSVEGPGSCWEVYCGGEEQGTYCDSPV